MKKEEVVTSFTMFVVSVLVLIGFTIAWYSGGMESAAVVGLKMSASEMGNIKIALEQNGTDIAELTNGAQYAQIELEELTNIEDGKLAPGAFGTVTYYVTPKSEDVRSCSIIPTILIQQGNENDFWYPNMTSQFGSETVHANDIGQTISNEEIEALYEITTRHIEFFRDEAMTDKIDESDPYELTWTDNTQKEQMVTIYWKWHYEYPFAQGEDSDRTNTIVKEKIDLYDKEDTQIGNNVSNMKFYFSFYVS